MCNLSTLKNYFIITGIYFKHTNDKASNIFEHYIIKIFYFNGIIQRQGHDVMHKRRFNKAKNCLK